MGDKVITGCWEDNAGVFKPKWVDPCTAYPFYGCVGTTVTGKLRPQYAGAIGNAQSPYCDARDAFDFFYGCLTEAGAPQITIPEGDKCCCEVCTYCSNQLWPYTFVPSHIHVTLSGITSCPLVSDCSPPMCGCPDINGVYTLDYIGESGTSCYFYLYVEGGVIMNLFIGAGITTLSVVHTAAPCVWSGAGAGCASYIPIIPDMVCASYPSCNTACYTGGQADLTWDPCEDTL